jgi:hypothetical protein
MLKHYNIALVMIDSPILYNLKFLYEITITSKDIHLLDSTEENQNTDTIIVIL